MFWFLVTSLLESFAIFCLHIFEAMFLFLQCQFILYMLVPRCTIGKNVVCWSKCSLPPVAECYFPPKNFPSIIQKHIPTVVQIDWDSIPNIFAPHVRFMLRADIGEWIHAGPVELLKNLTFSSVVSLCVYPILPLLPSICYWLQTFCLCHYVKFNCANIRLFWQSTIRFFLYHKTKCIQLGNNPSNSKDFSFQFIFQFCVMA